jgi:hypothetical protein
LLSCVSRRVSEQSELGRSVFTWRWVQPGPTFCSSYADRAWCWSEAACWPVWFFLFCDATTCSVFGSRSEISGFDSLPCCDWRAGSNCGARNRRSCITSPARRSYDGSEIRVRGSAQREFGWAITALLQSTRSACSSQSLASGVIGKVVV